MTQETSHFHGSHFTRMSLAVEQYKPPDPFPVSALRAQGVVFEAQDLADLLQRGSACTSITFVGLERRTGLFGDEGRGGDQAGDFELFEAACDTETRRGRLRRRFPGWRRDELCGCD